MKRLIIGVVLLLLVMTGQLYAATPGTVSLSITNVTVQNVIARKVITISWVASVDAATVPNTTIAAATYGIGGWYLYSAETNPGAGPPTDNYSITISDADGKDIVGGLLANRDTSTTELVCIGTSTHGYPIVRGDLTFALSGNSVNSAAGTCILTFVPN